MPDNDYTVIEGVIYPRVFFEKRLRASELVRMMLLGEAPAGGVNYKERDIKTDLDKWQASFGTPPTEEPGTDIFFEPPTQGGS